jgi:hypothetical protein
MPNREPAVAFDHHSAAVAADPAKADAALRVDTTTSLTSQALVWLSENVPAFRVTAGRENP